MRHAIITGLLLSALTAQASDYKTLVFQTTSGTTAVDLSSLVITVSDGKLVATNMSGTETFTLTDLSKMYFSTETSGIEKLESDSNTSSLLVYDLSGRKVGGYASLDAAKASLKHGVYVIKQNSKTFKIVVK